LKLRLKQHNAGEVAHTAKYRPWKLKSYCAFDDRKKVFAFEKYLKSGCGRAFAKRHFCHGRQLPFCARETAA
jgi:predicted GIY-YIG superfamily endonuclease